MTVLSAGASTQGPGIIEGVSQRVSSPDLVGRDEVLTDLGGLVEAARSGRPHLVLLGGDAGVGKSRVLAEVAGQAGGDGVRVLVGRCVDLGDSALPFAPVAQALRALADETGRSRLAQVLGPARRELGRVVPELVDTRREPAEDDTEAARGRLFAALLDTFQRVAGERPLLLAVEDIHWAETSTLDLLTFLARNLRDEPLLVIVTFRTDELHRRHPLRPVLSELTRLTGVARVDLEPLTAAEVATQMRAILGRAPERETVEDVARRSGGNPFYVEELLAARAATGPGQLPVALRDVVAGRLERLPDPTRRVLAAVAVVGQRVDHDLLERVTRVRSAEMMDGLRPAVDHHVLVADGSGYRFRHALVQEVVYDDLLPGEGTALHRRVAEALEEHPELASGGADHVDAELAHHWHAAHAATHAFEASLRAAEGARGSVAFAEALDHYERALAIWDEVEPAGEVPSRLEVLEAAATVARGAGQDRRSAAHLRAALDERDDKAEPEHEADLRRRLSRALWRAGEPDAALEEAERIRELVDERPPSREGAMALAARARLLVLVRDDDAFAAAERALDDARAVGAREAEAHALNTLGVVLTRRSRRQAGIDRLRRALTVARETGDIELVMAAYNNLSLELVSDQRRDEAEEVVEDALAWLDRGADRHAASVHLAAKLAWLLLAAGRWERAEDLLDRAARHHLAGINRIVFHDVRALLRLYRGELEPAVRDIAEARAAGALDDVQMRRPLLALETLHAALAGDLPRTRDASEAAAASGNTWEIDLDARLHRVRAEVDAALDVGGPARDEHVQHARRVLDRLRETVSSRATAHRFEGPATEVLLAEAELSRATGPDPERWRVVLAQVWPAYWRVHARWRLAESLLETDRREEAVAELRRAHEEAVDLDAGLLCDEIEDLARRARIALPGVEVTDASELGLTPRETEVLELVAGGCTNREIGEALYIAEKTASVHVSNILRKLDVDDRHAAAERARDLGLTSAAP